MKIKYEGFLVVLLMLCLGSCQIIGGIFKAGAFVGVIGIIVVIAIIIWAISQFRRKNQ